jgi:hypothetical protein
MLLRCESLEPPMSQLGHSRRDNASRCGYRNWPERPGFPILQQRVRQSMLPFYARHGVPRHARLIGRLGVPFHFPQAGVAADAGDLVGRAATARTTVAIEEDYKWTGCFLSYWRAYRGQKKP